MQLVVLLVIPVCTALTIQSRGDQRILWGNVREKVWVTYAKFSFFHSIPANATTGPFLQNLLDEVRRVGVGVKSLKAPISYEVMGKYLNQNKRYLEKYIAILKKQWPEYGITIMCDDWIDPIR